MNSAKSLPETYKKKTDGNRIVMTKRRIFLNWFLIGLSIFLLLNILASALSSDCGLPALFGLGGCADAISRIGFPFVFFEQGGFAYHSSFNLPVFIIDIAIGIGFAVFLGSYKSRKSNS